MSLETKVHPQPYLYSQFLIIQGNSEEEGRR